MSELNPKCPQCRTPMEQGFLLGRDQSNVAGVAKWVEGEPTKSRWSGLQLKDRTLIEVVSYRCTQCGLLLDFAPDAPSRTS